MRGVGLMIGLELVDPATGEPDHDLAHELEQRAFQRGLLLLTAGRSAIRVAPPLVVGADEIAVGLRILGECLDEVTTARKAR